MQSCCLGIYQCFFTEEIKRPKRATPRTIAAINILGKTSHRATLNIRRIRGIIINTTAAMIKSVLHPVEKSFQNPDMFYSLLPKIKSAKIKNVSKSFSG
jgi:hypothetical protein